MSISATGSQTAREFIATYPIRLRSDSNPSFTPSAEAVWQCSPAKTLRQRCARIQDYKIQCLISSPGGFENWLRLIDEKPSYQSDIEVLVSAGDVLSPSLSQRLRSRICSHLVSIYGSTECSMTAVANGHEIDREPRAVGFVAPGVAVEIVDSEGRALPFGQEGEIRVRSKFAADGYFRNPEESARVFRDGWFYPGDIGSLNVEGLLIVTGRQQAVLNIGGDKVSPRVRSNWF